MKLICSTLIFLSILLCDGCIENKECNICGEWTLKKLEIDSVDILNPPTLKTVMYGFLGIDETGVFFVKDARKNIDYSLKIEFDKESTGVINLNGFLTQQISGRFKYKLTKEKFKSRFKEILHIKNDSVVFYAERLID